MKILSDVIVNGNIFWNENVLHGLKSVQLNKEYYEIYSKNPKTLYESLVESQNKYPDKHCIIDDCDIKYTYKEFYELVQDFSKHLFYKCNVKAGTHIGLLLHNSIEFCICFYAINKLNATAVPLPTKYKKNELVSLAAKAELKGIICENSFSQWFYGNQSLALNFTISITLDIPGISLPKGQDYNDVPEIRADSTDTAIIMFTSGTSSQSKGVLINNYNTMHAVSVYQNIFKINARDSTILPIPIYHVTGLIALLGLFIASGGCIYLHKTFNAQKVLEDILKHTVTFLHGSPTVFSLLLEHKNKYPYLPSLRLLACGSSNMTPDKIKELKKWIPCAEFRTVYGLTETASPAAIFPDDAALSPHIGSSGHPVPGTLFKICNESGECLNYNHIGSIFIKGSVVTPGYLMNSIHTIKDGWLDTGDLGYFDTCGYLYIVDRKKDMINRGGEKICSIDVENALCAIPQIAEAAVVGIPDELYGEVPAAMIKLKKNCVISITEIKCILETQIANFKIPVVFIITDSFPLTPNSKIDKKQIRQILTHKNLQ